jgi:hypothetical protein
VESFIILKTQTQCPSDRVFVKLFAAMQSRNNRIRLNGVFNRYCTVAFVLESLLLVLTAKVVLQHKRPKADVCALSIIDALCH